MQKLTTTIRREPLAEIIAGTKKIEYREIKPYWKEPFARYQTPFLLRLINGMSKDALEVTVEVLRVDRDKKHAVFELHLGQILEIRNWRP